MNHSSNPLPIKLSLTAYHLITAPTSITDADKTAVKRTPILSSIIPANIRKNTNTFKNTSEPCIVPNAVESQPRVSCMRSLIGDRMSIKIYEQNMANASSNNAVQRIAAESRRVVLIESAIILLKVCLF